LLSKKNRPEKIFFICCTLNPETLSQLMRKMIEDQLIHFQTYDENMVLYERLLFLFNEYDVFELGQDDRNRFLFAFSALTGIQLGEIIADNNQEVQRSGLDLRFWFNQFMPVLQKLSAQKYTIPLEKSWITVADLMFPDADGWGYRGILHCGGKCARLCREFPFPKTELSSKRFYSTQLSL
jgi:hypothetical protein